jgi:squalene-associated FAD-dependent desaturase
MRAFGDWLREQGQSAAAIETLWSLIGRPTLNLDPEDASLAQAAQVFRVGLLEARDAGDVGYARVPLSEIHDVAARRSLERAGVEVRLGCTASSIRPTGAGFELGVGEAPLRVDAVVLAVPHERVAELLPDEAAVDGDRLLRLGRSPIVNLHVVYDRPVLDVPFAAATRTPVQWLFDRSAGAGLAAGQYLATSLSAADEEASMSGDELRELYLPALAALLPAARGARVEQFFVTREHAATFRATPGARALRPGPRTALPGLALAGAWTDTGWPATMEGAVRSGRAAAQVALRP